MLFAVEGGGFFSASASGYSKGLTLLLLGQKNEDRPMRVAPWNHYQLVDQDTDPELQLASIKNRFSRGCASFVCFGRTSAGLDSPSDLRVGPTRQQDSLPGPLDSDKHTGVVPDLDDGNINARKFALKSSLKKPSNDDPSLVKNIDVLEVSGEKEIEDPGHSDRRKVQWTDDCGNELVEIREFEPSEIDGSDDEFESGNVKSCSCTIM